MLTLIIVLGNWNIEVFGVIEQKHRDGKSRFRFERIAGRAALRSGFHRQVAELAIVGNSNFSGSEIEGRTQERGQFGIRLPPPGGYGGRNNFVDEFIDRFPAGNAQH